ncbi:MAG: hypothetical protein KAS69_02530 [Planctomycetes bacterium]|nr:hypothetical protein [Planctomycetota bacterium]
MKKSIIFVLAMCLFAAPAMAAVDITCSDDGSGVVTVSWDKNAEPNMVRAFALDITVDNGATITAVNDVNVDYGIYPGSIVIVGGAVTEDGSPVADVNDGPAGTTLPGLDSNGVTVEMGSLYVGDGNKPDASGDLFTFTVDGDCNVTIVENVVRGGVVLEDAEVAVDINAPVYEVAIECYAGQPDYDEWVAVGSPECWCYPRQCHGDADNASEGKGGYWVFTQDLNVMLAAWGEPLAMLTGNEICADFAHNAEGKGAYRVFTTDLNILLANWATSAVDPNCLD